MIEGAGDDETTAPVNGAEPSVIEGNDSIVAPRTSVLQYLSSPIVTLLIGNGDNEQILTAHQALLTQSTFFAEQCAEFTDDGSVGPQTSHCLMRIAAS
jgi:hypothetical protein